MPELPSKARIAAFYETYNDGYSGGGASQGRNLVRYARRYLRMVKRWRSSGSLIDVGSSNSPFPQLAQREGFETTVLDFVRPAGLAEHVGFIAGSINDRSVLAGRSGSFDVVTCWAVLEHVPNPALSARVLAGLCRPGGVVLLSTPEIGTAFTRHSLGRSPWFYPPEHLCLLSPRAILRLFEPLGLKPLEQGRLELTPLRYAVRYGIGALEAAFGAIVHMLAPRFWRRARDTRVHRFAGISYVVLRKEAI